MRALTLDRGSATPHHANPQQPWLYRHVGDTVRAAGVRLDGPQRWDPQIHRLRALTRLLTRGGYWHDATTLDEAQDAKHDLFLLHSIGGRTSERASDPWIERDVFPHSVLPSAAELTHAFEGRFVLEDWHNFGADYDRTLMAWHANIEAAWPGLANRYGDRFRRLWRYYLLVCAGAFRARRNQLWQLVLSPSGVPGGYRREEPWVRSSPAS